MFVFDRYYSSVLPHSSLGVLTIFRKKIVRSPNDKFRNQPTEFFQFNVTLQLVFFRCICISSFQNLGFKVFLEIKLGT